MYDLEQKVGACIDALFLRNGSAAEAITPQEVGKVETIIKRFLQDAHDAGIAHGEAAKPATPPSSGPAMQAPPEA